MNRDELIALAKRVVDLGNQANRSNSGHGQAQYERVAIAQADVLARAFLEADAEWERLREGLHDDKREWIKDAQAAWRACSLVTAERDAARAEVEALKKEGRSAWKQKAERLEAELSALRAEIEKAPVVYANREGTWGNVWGCRDSLGRDTHRARLVRIEKIGEKP